METRAHRRLKRRALGFLRAGGAKAAAIEVGCPITRFRIDAAGFIDGRGPGRTGGRERRPPRTIIVECKQCREDSLRENHQTDALLREREELHRIRRHIEEHRVKVEEPQLRRGGETLFAELDEWDFSASRLPTYRKVLRRLERLDEKIRGQSRFCLIARRRLADHLFLAAPRGTISRKRRCRRAGACSNARRNGSARTFARDDRLDDPPRLSVSAPAPAHECRENHKPQAALLRNIAVAASLTAWRQGSPNAMHCVWGPQPHSRASQPGTTTVSPRGAAERHLRRRPASGSPRGRALIAHRCAQPPRRRSTPRRRRRPGENAAASGRRRRPPACR